MQEPAASACLYFPQWVLLDTTAQIGRCNNATTAGTNTSTSHHIEVSFVVADPPALTRCVVNCADLTTDKFMKSPSCITGADGVFSVDGGSLAWVDLRIGIMLFNSLPDEDPEVRLIRLPPLLPTNYYKIGKGFDGIMPQLDSIRDVTCRNGSFWFIEMEFPELDDDDDNAQFNLHWTATIFKRMICSEEWDREPLCTVDSASLSPADSCFPCLFPNTEYVP
ncbi:hypothetical protein PR202_gb14494 [Eleusine coracana subsp. coracana]|uniref:DUF1618 domain-containing protein n=1 Tax=Eleusine coracana subsp. coracana TaxID=191504 RepID=A0AAV5EV78_ELECO|nr:hypothetical protein PR202_gb14494 [Eleusine coracana subsp. coracana]